MLDTIANALVLVLGFVTAPDSPRVWSNAADRVTLQSARDGKHRRRVFRFVVEDADALDLRFDRSQRGTAFDAAVELDNGARVMLVEEGRMASDHLFVEWQMPNVRVVEVTVHAHGRKLHLLDDWVGKRGRQ